MQLLEGSKIYFIGGVGNNVSNDPYLSHFPDHFNRFYIRPVFGNKILSRYFDSYNRIDHHDKMWQYILALDKYSVIQSVYFIIRTTVVLSTEIKMNIFNDLKLLERKTGIRKLV